MRLLAGRPAVDDPGAFLEALRGSVAGTGVAVQAFDARYVAGRDHLRRAVDLARRERDRGSGIADSLAVEVLCYAAGRRQIEDALEMGVGESTDGVVVLLLQERAETPAGDGATSGATRDDENGATLDAASGTLQERFDLAPPADDDSARDVLASVDESRLADFFEIGAQERAVALADLEALVLERVALLVVER